MSALGGVGGKDVQTCFSCVVPTLKMLTFIAYRHPYTTQETLKPLRFVLSKIYVLSIVIRS
jgi:hypothetical protein